MEFKKLLVLFLAICSPLTYGMEEEQVIEEEVTDYNEYKKMFFDFWKETALGTSERWKALKKGIVANAIQTKIFPSNSAFPKSYLAYTTPSGNDEIIKTLFVYPSTTMQFDWLFEKYPSVKKIFCIAPIDMRTYMIYGWKKAEKIPEKIAPNTLYFPEYDSNYLEPYVMPSSSLDNQIPKTLKSSNKFCITH